MITEYLQYARHYARRWHSKQLIPDPQEAMKETRHKTCVVWPWRCAFHPGAFLTPFPPVSLLPISYWSSLFSAAISLLTMTLPPFSSSSPLSFPLFHSSLSLSPPSFQFSQSFLLLSGFFFFFIFDFIYFKNVVFLAFILVGILWASWICALGSET